MAQENPEKPADDGGSHDGPATKNHDIVAAINALKTQYETAQKHRPQHDDETLRWTKRAAEGVFIYTGLTVLIAAASVFSALEAQRAVELSRKNFVLDQRPYIWLTNDFGFPKFIQNPTKVTGQIIWEWHFTDYGKTPANNLRYETFLKIGKSDFRPSFSGDAPKIDAGFPIPPNANRRHAAVSPPDEIIFDDFTKLLTQDESIALSGRIAYFDLAGNRFESAFCVNTLATGAVSVRKPEKDCENYIK